MSKNLSELSGRKGLDKNLFEELGVLARESGTPNAKDLDLLAEEFLFGKANVFGTTSFYDFLRPQNKGKKVFVCNGSSCLTAGTQNNIHAALQKEFGSDQVGEMCCLGRCHENGAFHYNGSNYSGQAIAHLDDIKRDVYPKQESYYVGSYGQQILTSTPQDPTAFYALWKHALNQTPDALLAELKASGLRGRGGAGFPIGFKLESAKNTPGTAKFVVCNADEGDPGAYSDRYLLEQQVHLVLLGMMLAGYVMGASAGVLYIRAEYPKSIENTRIAIEFLRQKGYIGKDIFGSGFNFDFKIIPGLGAYICGEETALLSSIEGQRPEVRVRPPYPTQQGLFNKPTVVNNVETLANIPYVIKNGGAAFAALGKGKSSGTKLVSLDGFFNRPGIYEVEMGTPLKVVIEELGMGFKSPIKAMHIGGPLGGLVPMSKIGDLSIDFETFASQKFLLGHASVVCLPNDYPIIDYIEHLFQFTAHESCGKCFPCRLGSTRGHELIKGAKGDGDKIDAVLFDDLITTMEIGSLCALGGGLPLPIRNALQYFKEELIPYFQA
ncbi:MAG: NADH-ubiquinone oxidoreductase-F iron-sulfur binding region domain-containing protein [bacterium]|nr:NADH-ubiquinone oxidoreductase-F iron-sulfur binding region domain-containing protein [bacterium]